MCAPMAFQDEDTFVEVDGVRVHVLHRRPDAPASGEPVIVLHGWRASIEAVGSILAGLGDAAELLAVDLPGFGESPEPAESWDVARYARLVVALADRFGFERFAIVGHSFGCRVSIVLSTEHPERVSRLVFTGAAGIKPRRKASYYAKVALAKLGRFVGAVGGPPGKRLQDRWRRKVASDDWLAASESFRGTLRNVLGEDLAPRLPRIAAPTLLIWGRDDADTPLWMGERMEREIPNAGLVVIDGGHFAYAERAGEFNRIARHFLVEQTAGVAS